MSQPLRHRHSWEFPGGPVVDTRAFTAVAQIQSLVGELRSHKQLVEAKTTTIKKKQNLRHSEPLAPLPGVGALTSCPHPHLQLPEELWLGGTEQESGASSFRSHPERAQAAGPHKLRGKGCHPPLCLVGGALVHSGARLFHRLG